jgi:hypothetical protein
MRRWALVIDQGGIRPSGGKNARRESDQPPRDPETPGPEAGQGRCSDHHGKRARGLAPGVNPGISRSGPPNADDKRKLQTMMTRQFCDDSGLKTIMAAGYTFEWMLFDGSGSYVARTYVDKSKCGD